MKQFLVRNLMGDVLSSELTQRFGELCRFPTHDCLLTDYCIQPTFCNHQTFIGCGQQTLCGARTDLCIMADGCGINYSTCFAGTQTVIIDVEQLLINPDDVGIVR